MRYLGQDRVVAARPVLHCLEEDFASFTRIMAALIIAHFVDNEEQVNLAILASARVQLY